MSPTQKIFAILASVVVLGTILELVRRRKLKEEYALLWIVTGAIMVGLTMWYSALLWVSSLIGSLTPTTTLFLFALLFLLLVCVHFSIVISRLTSQVNRLAQELAIMTAEAEPPRVTGSEDPPACAR